MGVNPSYSIYGIRDYAAEFREKAKESSIRMDQMLKDAGISGTTVPIGRPTVKDENKGLTVEHQEKEPVQNDSEQPENVQQEETQDLGNLALKEDRKKAEEKVKNDFLKYGTANGEAVTDEDQAQEMAEDYVRDKAYEQQSERTTVFMDKEKYKAAETERDKQYDELYNQYKQEYRDQGIRRVKARRMAKERANSELGLNEYVKNKQTRAFVENHEEMFYDEEGNFSSDKFKQQAVNFANTHTRSDEAENHYLSLKERREVAAQYGVDDDVISDIANRANIGYEKDYTPLIRAGVAVGGAAVGAVAGHFLLGASAAASAAGSSAAAGTAAGTGAGASASSAAAASASVSGTLPGAAAGLGAGAVGSTFLQDKGNKEPRIYEPDQPEPQQPPEPPEHDTCELTPGQNTVVEVKTEKVDVPIEYCTYKVKKNDLWYGIVAAKYRHEDGTPLNQKEMKEVWTGLKDMHNIPRDLSYIPLKELRLYSEINGKKYQVDCDNAPTIHYQGKYGKPDKVWNGSDPGVQTRQEERITGQSRTDYYYTDCNGNRSQNFSNAEDRDRAMAEEQARINAGLNQ